MISGLISLRILRIKAAASAQLEIREQVQNMTWTFPTVRYVWWPNWHSCKETLTIFSPQLKRPLTFREIEGKKSCIITFPSNFLIVVSFLAWWLGAQLALKELLLCFFIPADMIQNLTKASCWMLLSAYCCWCPLCTQQENETPRSLDTGDPKQRVEHTDRRVRATFAFTCTFARIQCGVGGRDRSITLGMLKEMQTPTHKTWHLLDKNCIYHNCPQLKVTSSNCWFFLTMNQRSIHIHFTLI